MIAEKGNTVFKLNFSFVLVLTLMLILCCEEIVIISFISSLLHEIGHLFFMYLFSLEPSKVELGAFGIRIERRDKRVLSYKKESLIALGGIFINFVVALFALFYYYIYKSDLAIKTVFVNLLIAAVNSVPVSILDMGRVIECLLLNYCESEKAFKALEIISLVFVNVMALLCIAYTLIWGVNISLIAVTVYIYIVAVIKKWS